MTRTNPFLAPVILMAGLTGACGQEAATAEQETAQAQETQALEANASGPDVAADTAASASPAAAETAAAPVSTAGAAMITSLPLKRGYYVASTTACGQASNADVMLVHRNGINASRTACEFTKIEAIGPATYRATESCSDIQSDGPDDVHVVTYVLRGDTSFTSKSESGWTNSARYCAQASMPPDWRENDISDLID